MFVSYSEVSVNVINKHVQHVGIIGAFCLSGGTLCFSVPFGGKGTEKIVALWFARGWDKGGVSTQADAMPPEKIFYVYLQKLVLRKNEMLVLFCATSATDIFTMHRINNSSFFYMNRQNLPFFKTNHWIYSFIKRDTKYNKAIDKNRSSSLKK